jgi:hypothetical protein
MDLILLEALGALVLLVVIVWWTMFSGRRRGEIDGVHPAAETEKTPPEPGNGPPGK